MKRTAIAFILWLCPVVLTWAEEPAAKVPVIGWLSPATTQSYQQPGAGSPGLQLLRDSLARHGLIDGKNVALTSAALPGRVGDTR